MSLKIGIVGLPNVGKSTLFNALTNSENAEAANYPFCTIDPNVGVVEVPDPRIHKLAELASSEKVIPAYIEFVDIAGLIKGASEGEGLGNQFLSHIRECDAIAQVVRIFEDGDVHHVHEVVDPARDVEIIESELILADLQTIEKKLSKAQSESKSGDPKKKAAAEFFANLQSHLENGKFANSFDIPNEDLEALFKECHLLTAKPLMYIINCHEEEITTLNLPEIATKLNVPEKSPLVPISAKLESELVGLSENESLEYLTDLGLKERGLNKLIRTAYDVLGLQTYFTAGPKEAHAWTIRKGDLAPRAAGVIHTDFEKGFIRADVIAYDKYIEAGSEAKARENGHLRSEGKTYEVKDGDVIHFHFNS